MTFQNSRHADYSVSIWLLKVGTYEMGIQIGYFLPSEKKPSILPLLSGQVGFHYQEVVESVEPCRVVGICFVRAILGGLGF